MKTNKYPMELETKAKQDFHMMHNETKTRAASLSNHSKENGGDSSHTWIIKVKQFIDNIQEKSKRLYSNEEEQSIRGSHTFSFSFKLPAAGSVPVLLPLSCLKSPTRASSPSRKKTRLPISSSFLHSSVRVFLSKPAILQTCPTSPISPQLPESSPLERPSEK